MPYRTLPIVGVREQRCVLVSDLIDILEHRATLLREQGMDVKVGAESISLIRGAYIEIHSILKRLKHDA